jgi:NAD(P)H-dependent FMN reductase
MDQLTLAVIIASTRPNRIGPAVARWFHELATAHGNFTVELIDIKEVNLPLFDEPKHPRFAEYTQAHTKAWSALVARADAFVFVTPEYNPAAPPSLVNAIDYLHREWAYKPAAFVSYGGLAGGTRAVQMTKQILTAVKVMPVPEGVAIPMVTAHLENGAFKSTDHFVKSGQVLLDELHRWAVALRPMRG